MNRASLFWNQIIFLLYLRKCNTTFLATPKIQSSWIIKSRIMVVAESTSSMPVDLKYIEFIQRGDDVDVAAEPVLLLHGLLGQKRNWNSLGTALVNQLERKRRIYALDLRNHGDNTHDWRDEMSYTQMAEDVLQFMNQRNIQKAICIGHSMGGKVAKVLALQYPHRVAGLVILDIAPVSYNSTLDSHWKAVETIIQALTQLKLDDVDDDDKTRKRKSTKTKKDLEMELRHTIQDPALRAFALTNIETVSTKGVQPKPTTSLRWKINLHAIQNQLHVLAGFDYYRYNNTLKEKQQYLEGNDEDIVVGKEHEIRYHGDTFFILGGQSKFVRNSHIPTIAHHFPNYMMTSIKGSGHWVHSEAPDDTLLLLKRYLDR